MKQAQPAQQTLSDVAWTDMKAIAIRKATLARHSKSSVNHAALHSILAALADVVKSSVSRGEVDGIMEAVTAASLFAEQIDVAHRKYLDKLRTITEQLSHVAVLISPKMVAHKNKARLDVMAWLKQAGVGTKADEATERKGHPPTLAKQLAIDALNEIRNARESSKRTGVQSFDRVLQTWSYLAPKAPAISSFSSSSYSVWWKQAKPRIDFYFDQEPILIKKILKECSGSLEGTGKTPRVVALKQVRDAFRKLAIKRK